MSIAEQAKEFANQVQEMLLKVLPEGELGIVLRTYTREDNSQTVVITQKDPEGVQLTVDGKPFLRLTFEYYCIGGTGGTWLKILKSSFTVAANGVNQPYFHYDYLANPQGKIPSAHLNVHGHRDDLIRSLLHSNRSGSHSKNRRRDLLSHGNVPTMSNLHFPVGGSRFRPGLEDVLQMVINEFGIDVRSGHQKYLEEYRQRYRTVQLEAIVGSLPTIAVRKLEAMGYQFSHKPTSPAENYSILNQL
ncbi:MAG: hypothetical protein WBA28_07750 [Microbacteriaceae bacterium]